MKRKEPDTRHIPSGFRNRRVREAHGLPLDWRQLTAVDIENIKSIVIERAADSTDLRTLEASLLLCSVLTTARPPAALLTLSVRIMRKGDRLNDQPPGLVQQQGLWGWWLPTAAPRDQRHSKPHMQAVADRLYLPATQTVARLVERCARVRQTASAGRDHLSGANQPLFVTGAALLDDVTGMLASRHPLGTDRARRATTTLEALARWLPSQLVGTAGGDVVPAAIITGRVPAVARTPIYYGAVAHRTIVSRYREAVGPLDALSHDMVPGDAFTSHLGDKLTPTDDAVGRLIEHLAGGLADRDQEPAGHHLAMMRYTVALLAFALAHRGETGTMPAAATVHAETRFCWIRDKVIRGRSKRRLVWICDTAAEQLSRYDRHLDALEREVEPEAASEIRAARAHRDLPLFDLRLGAFQTWTVKAALKDAMTSPPLPINAGRHWIRAKLVSRCSTETMHAFLGHGPIDDGSWDETSTLDPAIYRADIARQLDPVLRGVGWLARCPSYPRSTR